MNTYELFIDRGDLPKPLSKLEFNELLIKKNQGDTKARELLIKHNIRLVIYLINNKFKSIEYDKRDLVSIGNVALIKAVDSFDIKKTLILQLML